MTKSKDSPQPFPVIHKNECKGCNRCVISCKNNILVMSEDLNDSSYNYVKYNGGECKGCGDCYYTCPEPLALEVHIPKRKREKSSSGNSENTGDIGDTGKEAN